MLLRSPVLVFWSFMPDWYWWSLEIPVSRSTAQWHRINKQCHLAWYDVVNHETACKGKIQDANGVNESIIKEYLKSVDLGVISSCRTIAILRNNQFAITSLLFEFQLLTPAIFRKGGSQLFFAQSILISPHLPENVNVVHKGPRFTQHHVTRKALKQLVDFFAMCSNWVWFHMEIYAPYPLGNC